MTRPDQIWVADITYIRLRNEFVYLSVIMDVFTRCIRGWHLGRSLEQELTMAALERAFEREALRSTIPTRGCNMPRRPTSRC